MVKKTLLIVVIASCGAFGQRPDTPATVRQALGGQRSPATPPEPARVEPTSASAPSPITVRNSSPAADTPAEVFTMGKEGMGKRDPFVSPISTATGTALPGSNCSAGKRCLVIDQLVLRGVVKTATGMIAVVANSINKAYFLRENDPVFNGYVMHITGNSVVFKENTVDRVGHKAAREVVKKVTPPSA